MDEIEPPAFLVKLVEDNPDLTKAELIELIMQETSDDELDQLWEIGERLGIVRRKLH